MARIRTIKPEFPQSESMGRVSRDARLLFIQLWTLCDDEGRSRGDARLIKGLLYPYDEVKFSEIDGWLDELEREGCLVRYEADGSRYLSIRNWRIHQKIDKPTASKLPAPREPSGKPREDSREIREESSGDLDREGKGREGKGRDQGPISVAPDGAQAAAPPAVDDPVARVFDHWRTTHGHPQARLDAKRRRLIREALKGYDEASLCQSITGYLNSPHHMGQNDRSTRYDGIDLLLRDAKHIDAGLKFYAEPPRSDLSTLTRKNVAAIEEWRPPEMRNAS